MKAGSLPDDNASALQSLGRRHPQEKCASKCVFSGPSLCLHLFFNTTDLKSETLKSEVRSPESSVKGRVRVKELTQDS
jgi:hypothetical protein